MIKLPLKYSQCSEAWQMEIVHKLGKQSLTLSWAKSTFQSLSNTRLTLDLANVKCSAHLLLLGALGS